MRKVDEAGPGPSSIMTPTPTLHQLAPTVLIQLACFIWAHGSNSTFLPAHTCTACCHVAPPCQAVPGHASAPAHSGCHRRCPSCPLQSSAEASANPTLPLHILFTLSTHTHTIHILSHTVTRAHTNTITHIHIHTLTNTFTCCPTH